MDILKTEAADSFVYLFHSHQVNQDVGCRVITENNHQGNQIHDRHFKSFMKIGDCPAGGNAVFPLGRYEQVRVKLSCFYPSEGLRHDIELNHTGSHEPLPGAEGNRLPRLQVLIKETDQSRQAFKPFFYAVIQPFVTDFFVLHSRKPLCIYQKGHCSHESSTPLYLS